MKSYIIIATLLLSMNVYAQQTKGLLEDIRTNSTDEDLNTKKAAASEALIAKSELLAIEQLKKLLKKYKGTQQEPDLLYRLAELYMRRSKAGRFFDLYRAEHKVMNMIPPQIPKTGAKASIIQAIGIYDRLINSFPKYYMMDAVLFNNGFAHQQIYRDDRAAQLYQAVVDRYPESPLIPECYIALGEIFYEKIKFEIALKHFEALEKYPNSRMFPFSLYKRAWTHYNLKQTEQGIRIFERLITISPRSPQAQAGKHNLRTETIRDMSLFFSELYPADEAYSYFKKHIEDDEVGEALIQLSKLYDSHSRHKEITVFLEELIKRSPLNAQTGQARFRLLQTYEILKNRPQALDQLIALDELCKTDSKWRKANPTSEELCTLTLNSENKSYAKKWWELWNKDKSKKELVQLTQKALELYLARQPQEKPDFITQYAYAELLFVTDQFEKAAPQYEQVSKGILDSKIKHDSAYAAIVSLDKAESIQKKKIDPKLFSPLINYYLKTFPKGVYIDEVRFKKAYVAYQLEQYVDSTKELRALVGSKNSDIRDRSQDLLLDILNIQKDFVGLASSAKSLAATNKNPERKEKLTLLYQQAQLQIIQALVDDKKEILAADKFKAFFEEHKGRPMALDSLWRAISLYYSNGRLYEGAELSLVFLKESSDQRKIDQALEQAVDAYLNVGQIEKAAQALEKLALREGQKAKSRDHLWLALDLYELLQNRKEMERLFQQLQPKANEEESRLIIGKVLKLYEGSPDNKSYKEVVRQIRDQQIEPHYTEFLMRDLNEKMAQKDYQDAFDKARKIIGGKGTKDQKALARLVQAEILERELTQQSVKAKIDRLALVLSIKTEKLDKASTAYSNALTMTENPETRLLALQGLKRSYDNYVNSLINIEFLGELTADEVATLKGELSQLISPISEKAQDVDARLQSLSQDINVGSSGNSSDLSALPPSATYQKSVELPAYQNLRLYVPNWPQPELWQLTGSLPKGTCKKDLFKTQFPYQQLGESANRCLKSNQWDLVSESGFTMLIKDPTKAWGAFYLGLSAEQKQNYPLARWYINLALKKDAKNALFNYQLSRLYLAEKNGSSLAVDAMKKSIAQRMETPEQKLFAGLTSYQAGQCDQSVNLLSSIVDSEIATGVDMFVALSECLARTKKLFEAEQILEKALKKQPKDLLYLHLGRIHESYAGDLKRASTVYQKALGISSSADTKEWIKKKLEYLAEKEKKAKASQKEPVKK